MANHQQNSTPQEHRQTLQGASCLAPFASIMEAFTSLWATILACGLLLKAPMKETKHTVEQPKNRHAETSIRDSQIPPAHRGLDNAILRQCVHVQRKHSTHVCKYQEMEHTPGLTCRSSM